MKAQFIFVLLSFLFSLRASSYDHIHVRALLADRNYDAVEKLFTEDYLATVPINNLPEVNLQLLDTYLENGQGSKALKLVTKYEFPSSHILWPYWKLLEARIYFRQADFKNLIQKSDILLEVLPQGHPRRPEVLVMLGSAYAAVGNHRKAKDLLYQVIKKHPGFLDDQELEDYKLTLAESAIKTGDYSLGYNFALKVWTSSTNDNRRRFAEQLIDEVTKKYPKYKLSIQHFIKRGNSLLAQREFDKAQEFFSTLLLKFVSSSQPTISKKDSVLGISRENQLIILRRLAEGAMNLGDFSSSQLYLDRVFELNKDDQDALIIFAQLKRKMDQPKEAIAAFEKVVNSKNQKADDKKKAYLALADLKLQNSDWEGAKNALEKSIPYTHLRSEKNYVYQRLSWIHYKYQNLEDAKKYFANVKKTGGQVYEFAYWEAKILEKQNRVPEAKTLMSEICKKSSGYYGILARSWLLNHDEEEWKPIVLTEISKIRSQLNGNANPMMVHRGLSSIEKIIDKKDFSILTRAKALIEVGLYYYAQEELKSISITKKVQKTIFPVLLDLYHQMENYFQLSRTAQLYFHDVDGLWADEEEASGNEPYDLDPGTLRQMSFPKAYADYVFKYSKQYQVDPYFVWSIMRQESIFNPRAMSRAGARGLMQIMPSTARKVAIQLEKPNFKVYDLMEPETSIQLGSWYLKYLIDRFQGNLFLSSMGYNAGPHRVSAWTKERNRSSKTPLQLDELVETIPFVETRTYVKKVLQNYYFYKIYYDLSFDSIRFLSEFLKLPQIASNIEDIK